MAMQDALGPVFEYEWLRASRRWQLYAIRSAFVGAILMGLLFLWMSQPWRPDGMDLREIASFGRSVYSTIVNVELTLLLLAAPAATAGAVCLDKARGTLVHVMATDLTDAEIVLGKLAAALVPVVGLVFCTFPVQMLASLLGGADPATLLGSLQVSLGSAVLACTMAFALSVWGRKTHEVLSATYLIIILWAAILPYLGSLSRVAGWSPLGWGGDLLYFLTWTTPYALLQPPFNEPASAHLWRTSLFLGVCLAFSTMLTLAIVLQIRRATLNQRVETTPKGWRWGRIVGLRVPSLLPTPSLDANPVLWREWSRMQPSRSARMTWMAYAICALGGTGVALLDVLNGVGGVGELAVFTNMALVGAGLLLLSVRAAMSLSEERVRGSLDVLLTTPMTTPEILAGKWWGTFRLVPALAFLPALVAAAACLKSGAWDTFAALVAVILAYGAAVTSAGLAFAVWVPRQGRALALSVGVYVAACVFWVVFAVSFFQGSNILAPLFAMGSPLWGTIFGTLGALNPNSGPPDLRELLSVGLACWSVIYLAAAILLFAAACTTFDACLGRVPGRSIREPDGVGLLALLPNFRRERRGATDAA